MNSMNHYKLQSIQISKEIRDVQSGMDNNKDEKVYINGD